MSQLLNVYYSDKVRSGNLYVSKDSGIKPGIKMIMSIHAHNHTCCIVRVKVDTNNKLTSKDLACIGIKECFKLGLDSNRDKIVLFSFWDYITSIFKG